MKGGSEEGTRERGGEEPSIDIRYVSSDGGGVIHTTTEIRVLNQTIHDRKRERQPRTPSVMFTSPRATQTWCHA